MFSTRLGVAQSFFAPSLVEVVADINAISTGNSKTVASNAVRLMIATMETLADRSRGACHVRVVMTALRKAPPTAIPKKIQIIASVTAAEAMMVVISSLQGFRSRFDLLAASSNNGRSFGEGKQNLSLGLKYYSR